jgi:hypothetical protein
MKHCILGPGQASHVRLGDERVCRVVSHPDLHESTRGYRAVETSHDLARVES